MGNPHRRVSRTVVPDRSGGRRRTCGRVGPFPPGAVTFGLLVIVLTAMGAAWACVPQPVLSVQPLASGPPGSQVTVEGANFAGGRVELRWNGLDGPLLFSATGASFAVPISIPDGADGLYALVALERQQDGSVGGVARTAFQLVRSTASTLASPPQATSSTDDEASPSTVVAVTLGIAGAIALLVAGAAVGAATTRHRGATRPPGRRKPTRDDEVAPGAAGFGRSSGAAGDRER